MKKILVLVEGPTEDKFAREVLNPALWNKGLYLAPVIVTTRVNLHRENKKGGFIKYGNLKKQINNLIGDSSARAISTMFDLYKIGDDFPDYDEAPIGNCYKRVEFLENSFSGDISNPRFIPYMQTHEFEALLFTSPEEIAKRLNNRIIVSIEKVFNEFSGEPELIDEENPPSKRILSLHPTYQKVIDGIIISKNISVNNMREKCPHFNQWLEKLEQV